MALRGTLTHRKTRRLAQRLGIDPCFALGLVEALWNVAAEQAPAGDIGRYSDEDIAMEMFYSGDPAGLIQALVYAVYLDEHPKHRLIVHDWHEHSDDTTDNKLARAGLRYASGAAPRMRKLAKDERDRLNKLHDFETKTLEQAANPNLHGMKAGGDPAGSGDPTLGGDPASGGPVTGLEQAEEEVCARRGTKSHRKALPEPVPVPDPKETTPQPPLRGGTVDRTASQGAEHRPTAAVPTPAADAFEAALRTEAQTAMTECGVSNPRLLRVFVDAMRMQHKRERMSPAESRMMMVTSWERWKADAQFMRHSIGPRKFVGEGYWLDEKLWPVDGARIERERRAAQASIGMHR
jgi:hypothetical protein